MKSKDLGSRLRVVQTSFPTSSARFEAETTSPMAYVASCQTADSTCTWHLSRQGIPSRLCWRRCSTQKGNHPQLQFAVSMSTQNNTRWQSQEKAIGEPASNWVTWSP